MGRRYEGPVVWLPDESCYFAMPKDPAEHTHMPNEEIAKRPRIKWVAYNLDPRDPDGHWEYMKDDEISALEVREAEVEA